MKLPMIGFQWVSDGTLKNAFPIESKHEFEFEVGNIQTHTVTITPVLKSKFSREVHQGQYPFHGKRQLVLEHCLQLARIGSPVD
jgi:hypothetical protein